MAENIAVSVAENNVILTFRHAADRVEKYTLDAQNAFVVGEALARAAHEARFGDKPPSDQSYIAQQVRARVTEDLRDRLVTRLALMIHSMRTENKSDGEIAMQVVDRVLADAT